MKINWVSVKDKLPENHQRCLIWDKSCHVSFNGNPETIHHIYVATFFKGEHRPNGPWRSCDTGFGNNQFPWCWKEGAITWFSQDVTHWHSLPNGVGHE
jgi:hypothetical protein